eukprot:tig00001003_g6261.t1
MPPKNAPVQPTPPPEEEAPPPPPPPPPSPRTKALWQTLSQKQIQDIIQAKDPEEAQRLLAEALNIKDHATNLQSSIALDFHFFTMMFAKENSFSDDKISILFTVLKAVFDNARAKRPPVEECFKDLRVRLTNCAVQREPGSFRLFSAEEVRLITDFVTSTFFQHYKLYMYCLANDREEIRTRRRLFVETAAVPIPLSEYIPPEPPKTPEPEPPAPEEPKPTVDQIIAGQLEEEFGAEVEGTRVRDVSMMVSELVRRHVDELRSQLKGQEETLMAKLVELESKLTIRESESAGGARKKK